MLLNNENLFAKVNLNDGTVKNLDYIRSLGLNLELCVTDSRYLYEKYAMVGSSLKESISKTGVKTIMHLPFYGLQLGSNDYYIRKLSLQLIIRGIERGMELSIFKGVIHISMPCHIPSNGETMWKKTFLSSLEKILQVCEKNRFSLYLENTWEKRIGFMHEIFAEFDSQYLAMCLDIAHLYCFSGDSFNNWWKLYSSKIKHIHLSDNNFDEDSHLPLGDGSIEYSSILHSIDRDDLTFTIENDIEDVAKSLVFLRTNGLIRN